MKSSDLFAAFANPIRLRILNLLREHGEICVCDLCEVLGERQPKVSRHLSTLREVGLVEVRSVGRWKFYELASPTSELHRSLLHCVGSCLSEIDELVADGARLAGLEMRVRCDTEAGPDMRRRATAASPSPSQHSAASAASR